MFMMRSSKSSSAATRLIVFPHLLLLLTSSFLVSTSGYRCGPAKTAVGKFIHRRPHHSPTRLPPSFSLPSTAFAFVGLLRVNIHTQFKEDTIVARCPSRASWSRERGRDFALRRTRVFGVSNNNNLDSGPIGALPAESSDEEPTPSTTGAEERQAAAEVSALRLRDFLVSAVAKTTSATAELSSSQGIEEVVAADIHQILSDNASAITKGDLYEAVIEECLASCASEAELDCIRRADKVLRAAVHAERLRRARLKMKYLFAGTMFNQLEYTVNKLSSNGEIDDYLIQYIGSLIRAENRRSLSDDRRGGAESGVYTLPPVKDDGSMNQQELSDEVTETLGTSFRNSNSTVVLRNIRRLLEAERVARSAEGGNLRVLARLVHDPDDEVRKQRVSDELKSVEGLMSFSDYVDSAFEYFLGLNETRSSDGIRDVGTPLLAAQAHDQVGSVGRLPADVLSVLGGIRRLLDARLDELRTGLRDVDLVYSTDPNDYNAGA